MRSTTLLFLVKRNGANITEVCLAMKKRGFGQGRWNGVGGKVAEHEAIKDAARRETLEEIGVTAHDFGKVAELIFTFPHNPDWDQIVHVYLCDDWAGTPTESEEMKPEWYSVDRLPFATMWPDDPFWLPRVLNGELLKGRFSFGEGDKIIAKLVVPVSILN